MKTSESSKLQKQNIVIIGAGTMGNFYLNKLLELGRAPQNITVVDIDSAKLNKIREKHPTINVSNTIPKEGVDVAFVLSNTPAHLLNLEVLSALKVPPAILVEKPLFTAAQLETSTDKIKKLMQTISQGYTAYLIDFSPAVEALLEFMIKEKLVVIQGKGNWEKNRTADSRPSSGDLEDEMTHQLATLMVLARTNQEISATAVSSKLTHLHFVDPEAQSALSKQDNSIPEFPNSATRLDVELNMSKGAEYPVLLSMWSSFTSPEQSRVVQVELSSGGPKPEYAAKIIFDDQSANGDVLKIWKYPNKTPEVIIFEKPDKLALQLKAFLRAVQLGEEHPALKTLEDGRSMVDIARAAYESNSKRSTFIDLT